MHYCGSPLLQNANTPMEPICLTVRNHEKKEEPTALKGYYPENALAGVSLT